MIRRKFNREKKRSNIKIGNQEIESVKQLGSVITEDKCMPEVKRRV